MPDLGVRHPPIPLSAMLRSGCPPSAEIHSKFHITDDDDHHRYSEHLEFHVLELPKLGAADLADELPSRGYPRAL